MPGSTGVMISVQMPPMISTAKMRVWIRPDRVGSMSDPLVPGPLRPLDRGANRSDPSAEAALGEGVADLLRRDLQSEEGVDAREVPAERRGAGGVHDTVAARRPAYLEVAFDVEPADRVATGSAVLQQVGEDPVLSDVGLESGAVDHVVGVDLEDAVAGLDPRR